MCRWTFKAQHYDSVMLFKMGKFYEMFNMVRAYLHSLMAAIVMHSMDCVAVRHKHTQIVVVVQTGAQSMEV